MGLTAGILASGAPVTLRGGTVGAFSISRAFKSPIFHGAAFGAQTSYPQGYSSGRAVILPLKLSGNISARFRADAGLIAAATGLGQMSATVQAEADMIAEANVGLNGYATFEGEADMIAAASAIGSMAANMDLLARPSANDIAQEVWNAKTAAFLGAGTMGKKLTDAEAAAALGAALSA